MGQSDWSTVAGANMTKLGTCSPERTNEPSYDPSTVGQINIEFTFAFQPIVNAASRQIVSFEALLRGPNGESPAAVFAHIPARDIYRFDQACRVKAIQLARRLHLDTSLNLNIFPNSARHTGVNVRATLQASADHGFPAERLVFEVSESEWLHYYSRLRRIFTAYRDTGCLTAIDDFGSGYSGLRMLAEYQPNYIKLDRNLIAEIERHDAKQVIVRGILTICEQLAITPVAEGVETVREYEWLRSAGICLFQGYYFGRPAFEALCDVRPTLF
jgi:EAL domain-containing protein (putative c-di-GMP-specific phosphodiesterase class I)